MWPRRTCQQAENLLLAQQDRPLQLSERMALRMHLWVCAACPKVENQISVMQQAMQAWRHRQDH